MPEYRYLKPDDFAALKRHGRSLGYPVDQIDIDIRTAPWSNLHAMRSTVRRAVTATADQITKDTPEQRAEALEGIGDQLCAVLEAVGEEMDLREELGQREPLTQQQRENREQRLRNQRPTFAIGAGPAAGSHDDDGWSLAPRTGWEDRDGNPVQVLGPTQRFAQDGDERRVGVTLGTVLRAMVTGPRNDTERRALAEGSDSAGGFTVPKPLASIFIDRLRAESVCISAGAQTVPMDSKTLRIARLASDPVAAWRAENSQITTSDPTFEAVDFDAKSLMGLVVVSRELLEDSVNAAQILEQAFVKATALKFDQGLLFGSGTSNEPLGLSNAGITSVSMGTNGAALANYDNIIDTIYQIQLANAGSPNAMIFHPRTGASMAKLKDSQNNPLTVPKMVADLAQLPTTSVPINQSQGTSNVASTILTGKFDQMFIGLRRELQIFRLNEKFADYNQIGFVFGMRGDVQFAQKAAFAKLVGVL